MTGGHDGPMAGKGAFERKKKKSKEKFLKAKFKNDFFPNFLADIGHRNDVVF